MTRYKLTRTVTAGGVRPMTVTTTNPDEVERWMWDALSARDTKSITITREYVEAPKPKTKPECEGQRSILDELCPACGFSQCPQVGVRTTNCRLGGDDG